MKQSSQALDSQASILDAAEKTFADFGFDGASLRQIVEAANANLATVYYHFGSKEGLLEAVFRRVFGPVHEEHLRDLRRLEEECKGKAAPLEKVLTAMLMPPLRLAATPGKGETIMRLIGRAVTDPNPATQEMLRRQHQEVREAYLAAIHRSVPHLSKADLWWRFEFVWGAFVFTFCNHSRIEKATGGVCKPSDINALLPQMIAVFSAGFKAPACAQRRRS
jgi:AcrR family transcriptional regulator